MKFSAILDWIAFKIVCQIGRQTFRIDQVNSFFIEEHMSTSEGSYGGSPQHNSDVVVENSSLLLLILFLSLMLCWIFPRVYNNPSSHRRQNVSLFRRCKIGITNPPSTAIWFGNFGLKCFEVYQKADVKLVNMHCKHNTAKYKFPNQEISW